MLRSSWRFTTGIVNLPTIKDKDGHTVMWDKNNNGRLVPKGDPTRRYLFFELDIKDKQTFDYVISVYQSNGLSVYWRESGKGYHFISLDPLPVDKWKLLVSILRPYNLNYPPITIRIKPNKYVNEAELWKNYDVYGNDSNLKLFATWVRQQRLGLIAKYYFVVRYPFDDMKGLIA